VCTSISSTFGSLNPRTTHTNVHASVVRDNPHIAYFNGLYRGYCVCDVDRTRWRTTFRSIGTPADALSSDELSLVPRRASELSTDAYLEIRAGFHHPGVGGKIERVYARPVPLWARNV